MMNDQAADLRRMMEQMRAESEASHAPDASRVRTITVTSGKGGVGKSNVAVNLSIALAEKGARVALLDADWGLSNTEILMGISPKRDLRHVLRGECTMEEILIEGPHGMMLIPGATGVSEVANMTSYERDRLMRGLADLEHLTDLMVLDTSPGISDAVIDLSTHADQVLVVTTPEPTALTDAYAFTKVVLKRQPDAPVGLLVNMADDRQHAESILAGFNSVTERYLGLKVPLKGYVERDSKLQHSVRRQIPLMVGYPNSPSAACFRSLADNMLRLTRPENMPVATPDKPGPSFTRLLGRSLLQRFGINA